MPDPANSLRFDVSIGGVDLGAFTAIEGLEANYEIKAYDEGGENGFQHQLLGRIRYQNVKVTRPVDQSSVSLAAWFSSFQREHQRDGAATNASVVAFDDNRARIAEWVMEGVRPVRYSGPRFSTSDGKVVVETLEFAHCGFRVSA